MFLLRYNPTSNNTLLLPEPSVQKYCNEKKEKIYGVYNYMTPVEKAPPHSIFYFLSHNALLEQSNASFILQTASMIMFPKGLTISALLSSPALQANYQVFSVDESLHTELEKLGLSTSDMIIKCPLDMVPSTANNPFLSPSLFQPDCTSATITQNSAISSISPPVRESPIPQEPLSLSITISPDATFPPPNVKLACTPSSPPAPLLLLCDDTELPPDCSSKSGVLSHLQSHDIHVCNINEVVEILARLNASCDFCGVISECISAILNPSHSMPSTVPFFDSTIGDLRDLLNTTPSASGPRRFILPFHVLLRRYPRKSHLYLQVDDGYLLPKHSDMVASDSVVIVNDDGLSYKQYLTSVFPSECCWELINLIID